MSAHGAPAAGTPDLPDPYAGYRARLAAGPLQVGVGGELTVAFGHREVRALLADRLRGAARVPPAAEIAIVRAAARERAREAQGRADRATPPVSACAAAPARSPTRRGRGDRRRRCRGGPIRS